MELLIKNYHLDKQSEQHALMSALGLDGLSAPIISVVGGGGKTTVIKRLAAEYSNRRQPVIVTTTTHMKVPKDHIVLTTLDMKKLAKLLAEQKTVWLGIPEEDGKISSLPMPFLEACRMFHVPILIEADGAKEMPCKCPAKHEPAMWEKTTVVLGVVGLDAVGRTIGDVCHRPECVEQVLEKSREEILTCEDIVKIGLSENGMKKAMDPYMTFHIILNKADDEKRIADGEQIAELFSKEGFHNVCLTSGLLSKDVEYAIVVLAAGEGKRFGSNKLLADVEGIPMYRHMIAQLNQIYGPHKIIVTGYGKIKDEAHKVGITVINNIEPERGISHSMQLGIKEALRMNPRLKGILFTVCDQPKLRASTLKLLLDIAKENPHNIVCAAENGQSRNPVIWGRDYIEELQTLSGDEGGRQILNKYKNKIICVEIDTEQLKDVDRKADIRVY